MISMQAIIEGWDTFGHVDAGENLSILKADFAEWDGPSPERIEQNFDRDIMPDNGDELDHYDIWQDAKDAYVQGWCNALKQKRAIIEELRQVMTAQEIAEQFDIEPVTVYKNIERGNILARKSGGTWLIRRVDAAKRWGKPIAMLTLALSVALVLAQL